MTKQKIFIIAAICVVSFYTQTVQAQFYALLGPGTSSYSGDVSGETFRNLRPAFNAELWFQMNRYLYLKSGASLYHISANDVFPERNRDFRATNFEVYTSLMLGANPDWRLMPFAYAGIGISTNSPQYAIPSDGDNNFLNAKTLNTEGENIPGAFTILPLGVGVRFKLNEKLSIVADAGFRFTNSDLIDGVSASTIEVDNLSPEAISYFEAIRSESLNGVSQIGNGNPDRNDVYGIFSLKLQFKLNRNDNSNGIPCPPFYGQ